MGWWLRFWGDLAGFARLVISICFHNIHYATSDRGRSGRLFSLQPAGAERVELVDTALPSPVGRHAPTRHWASAFPFDDPKLVKLLHGAADRADAGVQLCGHHPYGEWQEFGEGQVKRQLVEYLQRRELPHPLESAAELVRECDHEGPPIGRAGLPNLANLIVALAVQLDRRDGLRL